MDNDLGNFAIRMGKIADGVESNADLMVKKVVTTIAPILVYATPIETSRARANWQGAANSIPEGILYYPHPDKPGDANEGTAEGIESIEDAASAYKSGGYVAIANNVPYIGALNDGYSRQAPAGFVELAVVAGVHSIDNMKLVP